MTSIHFLNRLSCYSLEAQEPILIYLTVYFVPISSAYGNYYYYYYLYINYNYNNNNNYNENSVGVRTLTCR